MTQEPKDQFDERAEALVADGLTVKEIGNMLRAMEALTDSNRMGDAPCSISAYMETPGGLQFLVAIRGITDEEAWDRFFTFVTRRIEQGCKPSFPQNKGYAPSTTTAMTGGTASAYIPSATTSVQSSVPVATTQPAQPATSAKRIVTNEPITLGDMSAKIDGGKTKWSVKTDKSQFPVAWYPEHMRASGIDPDALDPMKIYNMRDWVATEWEAGDKGFPRKILKAEKRA